MGIEDLSKLRIEDFGPYITHIRYPTFKNLQPDTRIEFNHPITALVGPNGTNKSSVLRSLQGCPDNYNIGNFWFDTDLDPISDGSGQRYIHGYRLPSGSIAEVIKKRVNRSDRNPDYFETASPKIGDGMERMPPLADTPDSDATYRNRTRWKSVEKSVLYLDFRQEIPAYDIHFHFNWRGQRNALVEKKQLIRNRARHVSAALSSLESRRELYNKNRILRPAESLSAHELQDISQILGRRYTDIRLVKHDFFNVEGFTAQMSTSTLSYSEAFAGSGEFAAIMLVNGVSRAAPNSLVLIDEPETSLHPGAQRELMKFVYRQTVQKKLQVVITTHSPEIVRDLPARSIKIFSPNLSTGMVQLVSQRATPAEAFYRLGASFAPGTIFVEDELAAEIIKRAARLVGPELVKTISLKIVPGGAGSIRTRLVPTLPHAAPESLVVLDGDQKPTYALRAPQDVPDGELKDELKKVHIPHSHFKNGGDDTEEKQSISDQRELLSWVKNRLEYLPRLGPEGLLLVMTGKRVLEKKQAKKYWRDLTAEELGLTAEESPTSQQVLETQKRALVKVDRSCPDMDQVCELLERKLT